MSSELTIMMLIDRGWQVTAISGHMEYHERDRVIEEFRNNVTTILISTDVLSRGFDSSNVSLCVLVIFDHSSCVIFIYYRMMNNVVTLLPETYCFIRQQLMSYLGAG